MLQTCRNETKLYLNLYFLWVDSYSKSLPKSLERKEAEYLSVTSSTPCGLEHQKCDLEV